MMEKCTNEDIGRLITFYEMGLLGEKERNIFEDHVLECSYCLHELQRLNPKLEILFEHKQEILESLQTKGISFEAEREKLVEKPIKRKIPSNTLWEKLYNFIRSNWFPKAAIPALAVAAAIIVIFVLPKSPVPENPYYKYLSFEKAPYLSLGDTRVMETEAQRMFNEGMRLYQEDDFESAIINLKEAAELDSADGRSWLYLGICYYLNRQSSPAVESLKQAEQILDTVQRNRALWFLAQAYLLDGDAVNSVPILQTLSDQNLEYAKEANYVLNKIRKITPGLFEN